MGANSKSCNMLFILKNIQAFWFPSYILLFFIFLFAMVILLWLTATFYLTYLIIKKITKITHITVNQYISLIGDWEFIQFKNNLLKFYYSLIIILFVFLFKHNFFYNLINYNTNSLYLLVLFILVTIFILLSSNYFILFLFNLYLNFKKYSQVLSDINFIYNLDVNKKNKLSKFSFKPNLSQTRKFSTSVGQPNPSNSKFNLEENNELVTQEQAYKLTLPEMRAKDLKKFKKAYDIDPGEM